MDEEQVSVFIDFIENIIHKRCGNISIILYVDGISSFYSFLDDRVMKDDEEIIKNDKF